MLENMTIEMEAERVTCPMLSLKTEPLYFNDGTVYQKRHRCEYIVFCKSVWQNWKKYHKTEREEK